MPPSPAMRCSPGRELKADNHKRGRSLEGFREMDDDLALFNEVQSRERDNFLLQSNDDFNDAFSSKLRYFSDSKLGISIPTRGESSDLLNADGEKNDYDWLLTPPDTPLFPFLDDEAPPVNFAQRGRPRSQPISISRSSAMEKSYRSTRGSASPNRLSPSPRSGSSTFHMRGRPSSAPHSSPTPSLQHTTPSRRPSPPPGKPSTPAQRSSTPTPRRVSTGSSVAMASPGVRGSSPAKTNRGNSASPKIRAWQTNIPGFSLEAPPNLRTSLADRPVSYVRGSSPASRNCRDFPSKSGRQSMSPTAARSVCSSYSHDRDRVNSHSKGSVASSGEDDVDSLQSVPMGSSNHSASRRLGAFPNNRTAGFSKKSSRTVSSSSAPKRSFDLALRQMEHRKGPQNMFRPLLSSVPSSTFYAGKSSTTNRAMISRNSSVTTSSNASSDQCTSGAHDTEGSEQNQEDFSSQYMKRPYTDVQDEVFAFDKAETLDEEIDHESHDGSCSSRHGDFNGDRKGDTEIGDSENLSKHDCAVVPVSESVSANDSSSGIDNLIEMVVCSRCGGKYHAKESIGDPQLCPDCSKLVVPLTVTTPVTIPIIAEDLSGLSEEVSGEFEPLNRLDSLMIKHKYQEIISADKMKGYKHEEILKDGEISCSEATTKSLPENSRALLLVEEGAEGFANQQGIGQLPALNSLSDGELGSQQMQDFSDVSEGAGICVLLKRSNSVKGHVVQSRTFTATSISYDDLSYVRDNASSLRSSIVHGSVSASSSVDLGSTKQTESRIQRQYSGKKCDIENYRYDAITKHQHSGSALSGISSHAFQASGLPSATNDGNFELAVPHLERNDEDQTCASPKAQFPTSESKELVDACTAGKSNDNCGVAFGSTTELSCPTQDGHAQDSTVSSSLDFEESALCDNAEDLSNNARNISSIVEAATMDSSADRMDIVEVPTQGSLDTISEIEAKNGHLESPCSQPDIVSMESDNVEDESYDPQVSTVSDKSPAASVSNSNTSDHSHVIFEESAVVIGLDRGTQTRSLTLEEATDTILFCSSIIQNLAYEAVTIAMEKENTVLLEGSRPTITLLGQSNSDRKDPRGRTVGRRTPKSQKSRQRRIETETKHSPSNNTESKENTNGSTTCIVGTPNKGDSMKPPKLESKCNCTVM